ncbi:hypothetical protein cand_026500 [Cryptosporidium andersoni]|uniref:Suppressor of forked domain-containing protein n=1 Tax=Cryptosporidium andersoni TaxID=117008 RepID=A0A1J4MDJ5_9CRYT|nr:hypothetical protein cand_026500 [Cryptosporidium andersoni]
MKKTLTSLIESIVERNPYDYASWESIFTVRPDSEVFERALEYFPTSPIVWRRYIEYMQNQKDKNESTLIAIYHRCIYQCPCVSIWTSYILFIDEHTKNLKDRYQIYQAAIDTVGNDVRSGFIWQRMYTLRLLVYNTLISRNEKNMGGNTLLLNPFETSTVPPTTESVEDCILLADKIATIVTMRRFFIQWLMTPVSNLETAFIAYSLFENSITSNSAEVLISGNITISNSLNTLSSSEAISKVVSKSLLQSGEKLVTLSKLVYKDILPMIENLQEDIPAKPLNKANRSEWVQKFIPWRRYLLYEKSNPLNLENDNYFNRVSFCYKNCLLYFSYHPELWYEYFVFVWNYHPVSNSGIESAADILDSSIQRFLPKDEILKLVLAEVYELRKQPDKTMHIFHSMIYTESTNSSATINESINDNDTTNNGTLFTTINNLHSKKYNPNVSAVVIIEYLNFVLRNKGSKKVWREIFLHTIKNFPKLNEIKWICYSQALNEWRLHNNLEGAYHVFEIAMYYRHLYLDISFMSCFITFLLDTGKLQQARSTLQSCIYEIYRETGIPPKQLWLQWFQLERSCGSSLYTLNYLNRIYQLQKEGKSIEVDMLMGKKQKLGWHTILGAPEFMDINDKTITTDTDPKNRVYGYSYVLNTFDDTQMDDVDNLNNSTSHSTSTSNINIVNNAGNLNQNTSNINNTSYTLPSVNSNKYLLTCPSKLRTVFECFRFGSIYPNSTWTDFYISEELKNIDHNTYLTVIGRKSGDLANNENLETDKEISNSTKKSNTWGDDSEMLGSSKFENTDCERVDSDDFECFLMAKSLEFRLIRAFNNHEKAMDESEDIDINIIHNIDDAEYYYYDDNDTFGYSDELKWSRIGKSLCTKPDITTMVKFRPDIYPTKTKSIIDNADSNSQFVNNKVTAYNIQLPKGIVDFVALLPQPSSPVATLHAALGTTTDVIEYLTTTLQTLTLPQNIELYKYTPISYNSQIDSCKSGIDMKSLQQIIQKTLPWYPTTQIDSINSLDNQNISGLGISNIDDTTLNSSNSIVSSSQSSFFLPNLTSNRFSNRPTVESTRNVQIHL